MGDARSMTFGRRLNNFELQRLSDRIYSFTTDIVFERDRVSKGSTREIEFCPKERQF